MLILFRINRKFVEYEDWRDRRGTLGVGPGFRGAIPVHPGRGDGVTRGLKQSSACPPLDEAAFAPAVPTALEALAPGVQFKLPRAILKAFSSATVPRGGYDPHRAGAAGDQGAALDRRRRLDVG
jgi:hypothetical protein